MKIKFFKFSLIFLLFIPIFIDGKAIMQENFKQKEHGLKSKKASLYWSIGATVIPFAAGIALKYDGLIAYSALVIGPSMGHFYAAQVSRGLATIGLRLSSSLLAGIALGGLLSEENGGIKSLYLFSFVVFFGSVVYDIYTAPASVQKYNESLLKKTSLRLIPEVNPIDRSYSLSLVYCF
jgi:hypothetical protein